MSLSRMGTPPHKRFPSLDLTPTQALGFDKEVLAAQRKAREVKVDELIRDAKRRKAGVETLTASLLAMIYIEGIGG